MTDVDSGSEPGMTKVEGGFYWTPDPIRGDEGKNYSFTVKLARWKKVGPY